MSRIRTCTGPVTAAATAIGPVSDSVEGGPTLGPAPDFCGTNMARREAAGERIEGFTVAGVADPSETTKAPGDSST